MNLQKIGLTICLLFIASASFAEGVLGPEFDMSGDTVVSNTEYNTSKVNFIEQSPEGEWRAIQSFQLEDNCSYVAALAIEHSIAVAICDNNGSAGFHLFEKANDLWFKYPMVTGPNIAEGQSIGHIDLSGNTLVFNINNFDNGIPNSFLVYEIGSGSFTLQHESKSFNGLANHSIEALSIHNGTLAIAVQGTPLIQSSQGNARVVFVFEHNSGQWNVDHELRQITEQQWGFSTSVFENTLLIAQGERVFFYSRNDNGVWNLTQEFERIGSSVAVSKNRAVVASYSVLTHFQKDTTGKWIELEVQDAFLDSATDIGLGNNHAVMRSHGTTSIYTLPAIQEDALGFCIDTDGDGWGWDGATSCRIGHTAVGTCEDSDGDYWGWNGSRSCRISY